MLRRHGLTLGVSTRRSPDFIRRYAQHLLQTVGVSRVQLLFFYNPGRVSLAEVYNQFLVQARFQIVCLLHDDLVFSRNRGWGRQVIRHFQHNPEFAILGVAGSLGLEEHAVAWAPPQNMLGHLWHQDPVTNQSFLSDFSGRLGTYLLESVTLDGLFLALHQERTDVRFNPQLSGFHFYDVQLTLDNWLSHQRGPKPRKNGVMTDIKLKHLSTGTVDREFDHYRQLTIQKYQKHLPLQPSFSLLKFPLLEKMQLGQKKLAIILLHLAPDLALEPCLKLLSGLNNPTVSVFYAGTALGPGDGCVPLGTVSWHPMPFRLRDFSLGSALTQVLPFVQLEQFEWVLVWDSRILPQAGALESLLDFARRDTSLPLGTLGLRLHYSDHRVYFSGLDILRDGSGSVHCLYHGIHTAYRHAIAPKPTPYNYLGFSLMSAQHLKDPGNLSPRQTWIPGLEFNLNCLKMGYFNYLLGHLVGIYRESVLDLSVSALQLEREHCDFQDYFLNWLSTEGNSSAIQAWVRQASVRQSVRHKRQ
ncbi:MAG: hypothetical protein IV090_11380 [Candidatus Sericytochromatia bacterium]|nr:hypothetical protein [Candidatus Sericytochromatia bacterium]